MKPQLLPALAAGLIVSCHAGPTDRAILAAMKLAENPNYSWTTTVVDDARSYDIQGKTDDSGYTWMRLPVVPEFALRLGREAGTDLEAVFHGGRDYVVRTDHGWKTIAELPRQQPDWVSESAVMPAPVLARQGMLGARMGGLDPLDPFPPSVMVMPPLPPPEDDRPYSNAQFALSRPHEELSVIVSSYADLQVSGDVVSGTLTDLGAQLLLVHEAQDHIQPLAAAGAFRLQVTNGLVTRYFLRLEGILLVNRKKVHVHQESSTEVRAVGTTRVSVSDEVRRKLGG